MWATFLPIVVFLGLSVLELGQCTRQTDVGQTDGHQTTSSLNDPAYQGRGHNKYASVAAASASGLRQCHL